MPWTPPPQPVSLPDRFGFIITLILTALGNRGKTSPVGAHFAGLIYRRICALRQRFRATLARGPRAPTPPRLRRPTANAAPAAPAAPTATNPHKTPRDLPTRYGWLLRLLPQSEIATARRQLMLLLDDPAMIALITSHSTLGRTLRPLCHLLYIPRPPILRRPPILHRRQAKPQPAPQLAPQPAPLGAKIRRNTPAPQRTPQPAPLGAKIRPPPPRKIPA